MDIPLRYITAGEGEKDECRHIYGLTDDGKMYAYDPNKDTWKPKSNPRTGAGKDKPDEIEGEHRNWKDL